MARLYSIVRDKIPLLLPNDMRDWREIWRMLAFGNVYTAQMRLQDTQDGEATLGRNEFGGFCAAIKHAGRMCMRHGVLPSFETFDHHGRSTPGESMWQRLQSMHLRKMSASTTECRTTFPVIQSEACRQYVTTGAPWYGLYGLVTKFKNAFVTTGPCLVPRCPLS